jgi:hypothetical protein
MNTRGQYGDHALRRNLGSNPWARNPYIGIGLPLGPVFGDVHSITDIEDEVKALHTEMMSFGQELSDQLFLQDEAHRNRDIPKPGVPEDKIALYTKVWRPLMNEWIRFHEAHHDSFWQNLPFGGAWDRVQDFRSRLIKVRDEAKKENFRLQTPDPVMKTDGLDLKKIGLIAGAGLIGLVALVLVTRR